MRRWRYGARVKRCARLSAIRWRALRALRCAGIAEHVCDSVRFRWWAALSYVEDGDEEEIHGSVIARHGVRYVDVVVDGEEEATVCHELARVVLSYVEAEKLPNGDWHDEHGPHFAHFRAHIRGEYYRLAAEEGRRGS